MSLCPTINIAPCNIIGDKDNISIKIAPRMVEDVKKMYGIDLENKKLLAHGMNSKETKRALLKDALEVIDLLRAAFKDSKETLNSPEFRIKA